MKKMQILSIVLTLFCAAALTACGTEPIQAENSAAVTTAVTDTTEETTAEAETETTAKDEKTTAAAEKETTETSAETDTAETTTTAAETTAEEVQQTTEAPATQAPQQTEAPATEAPKQEQHLFDALKLGGSAADYRASHTNFQMRESDACLSGKDYEYTYPDFVVLVNVDNGVEKIKSIKLTGEGVSTREGIHVGSTREEAQNAYGPETSVDIFTKSSADGNLEVVVEHGIVVEILLYAD